MKRFDSALLRVFLLGLPVFVVFAGYSSWYQTQAFSQPSAYFGMLNSLAGLVIALWMALALYLSFRLLVSERFRDRVLTKLTFFKERDEREAILTGQAARKTFLTTLAVLILLLCLSCFQVSIYRVPPQQAVDGKTGFISLGVGFSLLDQGQQVALEGQTKETDIFSYSGLPITSTAIILLLIGWLIMSYNRSMRRLTAEKTSLVT